MPAQNDQTQSLLRGLLASARDGRWCYDDIAAWLRGETVRDHYQTRRRERLFRYRNRAYTPAEAADALRTSANWPHLIEQVYEPQKPGTLANFIHDTPGLQDAQQRWATTLALTSDETLQQFPIPLVREVVASLALLELAGNRFIWRGHTFDATWLNEWLERDDFDRLSELRGDVERESLAADLSFGAAILGTAIDVVLWFTSEPDASATTPAGTRSATWHF